MDTEAYFNTFTKIFEITRDNGTWFVNSSGDHVSVQSINMFSENKALFMDTVMFYLEQLREMLDLIFATRIIDFGDTVWVDVVRDGVLSSMYSDNNRNLSSKIKTKSKQIKGKMKKLEDAIPNWDHGS